MSDELYPFDPAFEKAVVALCANRPRFYGRIGTHLVVDAFNTREAKLAMKAVHACAKSLGRGPSSSLLVAQRLRRWVDDGKYTLEECLDVIDFIGSVESTGLPAEDDIAQEIAPVLQQRAKDEYIRKQLTAQTKVADEEFFLRAAKDAMKNSRIGAVDTSVGIRIGADSFGEIERMQHLLRLPTGIMELDVELGGGLTRSALGVAVGGAGDGKSMFLSHSAAHGMYEGQNVAYATLEIPEGEVLARIKANLTNCTIDGIKSGEVVDIAKDRLAFLADRQMANGRPGLGAGFVKEFPAYTTEPTDIDSWVRECEDAISDKIDLIVVDYADRMGAKVSGKEKGDYTTMRIVYEGLRQISVDRENFLWTASQATRQGKDKRKLDVNHMADSMHKGRIADLVISLNVCGEHLDEIEFFIAKHRTGKGKISVGPMQHEFSKGRIAPPTLREHGF